MVFRISIYLLWRLPMEEPDEEIKKEDIERMIARLENEKAELIEEAIRLENKNRYLDSELQRFQKEVRRLKRELDRLKEPPLIIGTVREKLPDGRVIIKSSTGPDFIVEVAEYIDPDSIMVDARAALNKQSLAVMSILPPPLDPIVIGAEIIEKPEITYGEIGGLKDQIREIKEAVEYPLLNPELYKKVGIEPPKGVLLVGPPGTGKTLMAKAVAHQTKATFIRFVGSELVQKYIGEGARLVRELFALAREKSPSIVFIDEIDSIGARRMDVATSGDREVQRTLMQFLAELDGFDPVGDVKIIGATNRPDILDEALLRPGRFDRIIEIPLPDYEARVEIFGIHTNKMNIAEDVSLEALASKCDGSSGAEIKAICTEAGMFAIRDGRDFVTMEDFENAIEKVMGAHQPMKDEHLGVMFA